MSGRVPICGGGDKLEPATAELIKVIGTDAIKILGPALIAAYAAYRAAKIQFSIEKLKIHDKDRIEAYKRLLAFSRKLGNEAFPLAENKRSAFVHVMKDEYLQRVELDYVYFSKDITKILDEFESRYVCMTRGELIPEMDTEEENNFLEKKLFSMTEDLAKHAKKAVNHMM